MQNILIASFILKALGYLIRPANMLSAVVTIIFNSLPKMDLLEA